jgi:hypothetical protein
MRKKRRKSKQSKREKQKAKEKNFFPQSQSDKNALAIQ